MIEQNLLPYLILTAGSCIILLMTGVRSFVVRLLTLLILGLAFVTFLHVAPSEGCWSWGALMQADLLYRVAGLASFGIVALLIFLAFDLYRQAEYYALIMLMLIAFLLTAGSVNLFMIVLGLEMVYLLTVILILFPAMVQKQHLAGLKYYLLGGLTGIFALLGTGMLLAVAGSTQLDAIKVVSMNQNVIVQVGLLFVLINVFFKLSLAPFHQWTPDVFRNVTWPVLAILSTITKLTALVVLIRIATSIQLNPTLLIIIAVLSMVIGNISALTAKEVRTLLAFSTIAQMGNLLIGFVSLSVSGISGSLFYLLVYSFTMLGLTGCLQLFDGGLQELDAYRGLAKRYPGIAAVIAFFLLVLAGLPPLAGFWSKLFVFLPAYQAGGYWLVVIALVNALIAMYYYLSWIIRMYMQDGGTLFYSINKKMSSTIVILSAFGVVLYFTCAPQGMIELLASAVWGK